MVYKKILGVMLSAAMVLGGMNLPAYATNTGSMEDKVSYEDVKAQAEEVVKIQADADVKAHAEEDVEGELTAYADENNYAISNYTGDGLPDFTARGAQISGFSMYTKDKSHGTDPTIAGTIKLNLQKTATVTIEGCEYGQQATMTAASAGDGSYSGTPEVASGVTGKIKGDNGRTYTFKNVPAGIATISVGKNDYIHGFYIKYSSAYSGSEAVNVATTFKVGGADLASLSTLNGAKFTFTQLDPDNGYAEKSTYVDAAVTDGAFALALPAGQYRVSATGLPTGYSLKYTKDVIVNSSSPKVVINLEVAKTAGKAYTEYENGVITVGEENCDFKTVSEALEAVRLMNRTTPATQIVTISIQPGDYHEMPVIDVPYVKLVNASETPSIALKNKGVDADANAVRITSHYGHGYSYYSMGSDYKYDPRLLEVNKANGYPGVVNPGSGSTTYWNATVVIKADHVSAENIIFENSFNQYVAPEAVSDGQLYTYSYKESGNDVFTLDSSKTKAYKEGATKRVDMEAKSTKVQEKSYVERAAALAIAGGSQIFFDNCKFVGRQDTLYGNNGSTVAFYGCDIYGAVDYIFGGMTAVFAKCNLVANTNDSSADSNTGSDTFYITAPYHKSGEKGYLMYNCNIVSTTPGVDTASSAVSKQGYFGRPWKADTSEAVFFGTNIATTKTKIKTKTPGDTDLSIIADEGWLAWNSDGSGHTNYFYEIGSYESRDSLVRESRADNPTWVNAYQKLSGATAVVGSGEAVSLTAYTTSEKGAPGKFLGDWDPFAGKDMAIEQKAVSTTSNETSSVTMSFTKEGGWFESLYAELSGVKAENVTKVAYVDSEDNTTELSAEDLKYLVRTKGSSKVRIDIPGVKPGTYTLKVTAAGKTVTSDELTVKAYDRAGYGHFNYTGGVGAYKNDGTLKENALVVYVTDDNKNTVTLTYGGKTYTGVGDILGNVSKINVPLDVRFVGIVSESGLYKREAYDPSDESTYNITGLSKFSIDAKDNGHMLAIKQGKDITLEGIGGDAVIDGWGFSFSASSDDRGESFEARNLTFINTPEDALGMEGQQTGSGSDATLDKPVEHCWIHNNSFYRPNLTNMADQSSKGYDKYEGDGTVDFKRGQYLTVAYNYFDDCHKTSLIGGGDEHVQFNLTYHHNHWKNCNARIPMARWANIHSYNNIIDYQNGTGMDSRYYSYIFSEHNLFYMASNPMVKTGEGGAIKSYKDSLLTKGTNNGTIVTEKTAAVSNSCAYVKGGVDYSSFETSSTLSYITDESNYNPETDFIQLRKIIAAYCGVMQENPREPGQIAASEYSVITGKDGVHDGTVINVTEDDFSKTALDTTTTAGYAFRIYKQSDVTIAYKTADSGVLINEAGEVLMKGDGTKRLDRGVYMIQSADFNSGAYGAGNKDKASAGASNPATFKAITINSLSIKAVEGAKAYYPVYLDYNYSGAPAAIVFEAESGSAYASQDALLTGTGFARAGRVLMGLYTDKACTTAVTYPLTISGETTLYAKWDSSASGEVEEPESDSTSSSSTSGSEEPGSDDTTSSSSSSSSGTEGPGKDTDTTSSSSASGEGKDDNTSSSSAGSDSGTTSSSSSSKDKDDSSSDSGKSDSGSSSSGSGDDKGNSSSSAQGGSGDDGGKSDGSSSVGGSDGNISGGTQEVVSEEIINAHVSGNTVTRYTDKETGKAEDGTEFTLDIYIDNNTYDATKKKPEITVFDKDNNKLVPGRDYKVSYKNNKNANMIYDSTTGKFTAAGGKQPTYIVKFKGAYKGSKSLTGTFDIYPFPVSYAMIFPKADTITAKTGRSFKFVKNVTALLGGKTKKLNQMKDMDPLKTAIINTETGEQFTMADNATAPEGTYMIRIEGKGNFYHYKQDGQFKLMRK